MYLCNTKEKQTKKNKIMTTNLFQELTNGTKKVQIYRVKSYIKNGYDYYIHLLNRNNDGVWFWNESYKQINEINSFEKALEVAKQILK